MTERKTIWICLSLFTQRHIVKVKHLVFNWLVGKDIHGSWGMNSNDFCGPLVFPRVYPEVDILGFE